MNAAIQEKAVISNQQSAISSQQSAVSNQQSAISGRLSADYANWKKRGDSKEQTAKSRQRKPLLIADC
jgi:type IV secretory pathway TrbL component